MQGALTSLSFSVREVAMTQQTMLVRMAAGQSLASGLQPSDAVAAPQNAAGGIAAPAQQTAAQRQRASKRKALERSDTRISKASRTAAAATRSQKPVDLTPGTSKMLRQHVEHQRHIGLAATGAEQPAPAGMESSAADACAAAGAEPEFQFGSPTQLIFNHDAPQQQPQRTQLPGMLSLEQPQGSRIGGSMLAGTQSAQPAAQRLATGSQLASLGPSELTELQRSAPEAGRMMQPPGLHASLPAPAQQLQSGGVLADSGAQLQGIASLQQTVDQPWNPGPSNKWDKWLGRRASLAGAALMGTCCAVQSCMHGLAKFSWQCRRQLQGL